MVRYTQVEFDCACRPTASTALAPPAAPAPRVSTILHAPGELALAGVVASVRFVLVLARLLVDEVVCPLALELACVAAAGTLYLTGQLGVALSYLVRAGSLQLLAASRACRDHSGLLRRLHGRAASATARERIAP